MKEVHKRTTVQPSDETFSVTPISASSKSTEKEYRKVEEAIMASEYYDQVFLNNFAPENRYVGCHWIDSLSLQFVVILYKYVHGSHIGTLAFAWKTPEGASDPVKTSQLTTKLTMNQAKYSFTAMRMEFLDKYNRLSKTPKIFNEIFIKH